MNTVKGIKCDACGQLKHKGSHIWHCSGCSVLLCPSCRKNPCHRSMPTSYAPPPPLPADVQGEDSDAWECLIADLPCPTLGATAKFVPQHLACRYAATRLRALELAMEAESNKIKRTRVAAYSKLAAAMPYLLLHHVPPSQDQSVVPPSFRAVLTRRLLLAEQGQFAELIREAMSTEEFHAQVARDRPAGAPRSLPAELQRRRDLERAAERAEDGCLRAAAQQLRPAGTLEPGTDTTAMVKELYLTASAAPLPPRPAHKAYSQVLPKVVADRVREARGSSAPGPLGERNTHVRTLLLSPRGLQVLTKWTNLWPTPHLSA